MRHTRTLGQPSLYRWIFLATLMLGLAASALYSSSLPVYSISGHTFLWDNQPFNFVTVELLDNAGNVIDSQQTQAGAFQFTAVAGTYSVRLNQPGYAYLGRLQSFELTANLECVDLWIGPDSWFPQQLPLCVSPDGSTNMTNTTPCAVDLTATAELTDGSSVTSPPVRIYFLPTLCAGAGTITNSDSHANARTQPFAHSNAFTNSLSPRQRQHQHRQRHQHPPRRRPRRSASNSHPKASALNGFEKRETEGKQPSRSVRCGARGHQQAGPRSALVCVRLRYLDLQLHEKAVST
jgi:hypothetical protein